MELIEKLLFTFAAFDRLIQQNIYPTIIHLCIAFDRARAQATRNLSILRQIPRARYFRQIKEEAKMQRQPPRPEENIEK